MAATTSQTSLPSKNTSSTTTCTCTWQEELRHQLSTALPTLLSLLLYKFPWLISLRFVGGLGAPELAAAALAATLCNVTGLSLSVGLSSAVTTLAAQARGDLLVRHEILKAPRSKVKVSFNLQQHNNDSSTTKIRTEEQTSLLVKNGTAATATDRSDDPSNCSKNRNNVSNDDSYYDDGHDSSYSGHYSSFKLIEKEAHRDDSGLPLPPLVFLYRGLFIQALFVFPIGLWWLLSNEQGERGVAGSIARILMALGQGEELSRMTQAYLRVLAPGLWSYSINWTLTAWLQAMEMAHVPAYAAGVGLATHIPFNVLFVYYLDWGYLGCAAATVMFQLIQPLLMIGYLFFTKSGKDLVLQAVVAKALGRTHLSFSTFRKELKRAMLDLPGIETYLGLAVPGVVLISEWWASEVSIFLAGRLVPQPDLALGAMTLYQSMNTFCFMFPVACSVAGSARVGNCLGGGNVDGARLAARVCLACSTVVSAILGGILYWTKPHTLFPSLFAPDETELVNETARTMTLLAIYVFADGIQSALNGIVKGCGRQPIIMPVVVVAYWVVGVPLAYTIAFERFGGVMCTDNYFCGDVGLVAGMTVGTWVHMLLLAIVVLGFTNWHDEARKAQERINVRHHHESEAAHLVGEDLSMLSM